MTDTGGELGMDVLGVDWGKSHLGLALGSSRLQLAEPWKEIALEQAAATIVRLCARKGVTQIVVGVSEGMSRKAALQFILDIKQIGIPVAVVDETLSSQEARRRLRHRTARQRALREHATAAAILLERWFEDRV